MPNYEYTAKIDTFRSGSSSEKILSLHGGVMKRKFSRQSGSLSGGTTGVYNNWKELWIGMIFRWEPSYNNPNSLVSYSPNVNYLMGTNGFFFGLNHSSGSAPGETGSYFVANDAFDINPRSRIGGFVSHSIGFVTGTENGGYFTKNKSGNIPYALATFYDGYYKNNVYSQGLGMNSFRFAVTSSLRQLMVFRFFRTGSLSTQTAWTCSMAAMYGTGSSLTTDFNDQQAFGNVMSASAWGNPMTASIGSDYQFSSLGSNVIMDESKSGSFDEIVFSWNGKTSPWKISTLVMRVSGSITA